MKEDKKRDKIEELEIRIKSVIDYLDSEEYYRDNIKDSIYKIKRVLDYEKKEDLKKMLEKAIEILIELYGVPCEIDGFMDKEVNYCMKNCSVDEKTFKRCWKRYIERRIMEDEEIERK